MWYAASLLFRGSHVPGNGHEPLWEESIRLIDANSESEAQEKAQRLGQSEVVSYQTRAGKIAWSFDRVERIFCIEARSLADGTELFSRFLRDSEVSSLLTPFDDEL